MTIYKGEATDPLSPERYHHRTVTGEASGRSTVKIEENGGYVEFLSLIHILPGAEQNSKSIQTWAYAQYESGVRVYEYDFMFDSGVHSLVFALQSSNFRELRILNSQRTQDGDMNITTSDGKTQLAKKNQWHHVKMIADFSKTKKNADSTADILDFSQNTITCYLDGQLMIDSRPAVSYTHLRTSRRQQKLSLSLILL